MEIAEMEQEMESRATAETDEPAHSLRLPLRSVLPAISSSRPHPFSANTIRLFCAALF